MEKYAIRIAEEFGDKLGGRWKRLGPNSGEQFYEDLLEPSYKKACDEDEKLHIYLDGAKGYGSSFLDQSLGALARKFGVNKVKETIVFHTTYFEWVVEYINKEIWEKM